MKDIISKDYAKFLEETLQNIAELPVESICIMTKMTNGGFYTSCYNISVMEKIACAGLLQQDAMMEVLRKNKLIGHRDDADQD